MLSGNIDQEIYLVSKVALVKVKEKENEVTVEDLSFKERAEHTTVKLADLLSVAAERMESVAKGRSWEIEITGTFALGGEFLGGKVAFDATFRLSSTFQVEQSKKVSLVDKVNAGGE